MGDASLDLEGVASDGDDGLPQALAGSVVAGGLGAMDTLAVGAQGAAPVAEGAGVTEQRIRQAVPGLPVGNLTVAVLKSQLQMYGGAMFVLDDKTRHKAPNEHIFNKGAIKRDELLDAWRRFMDKPGDQRLSDEDLVVRKAAPGSRGGTRRVAQRGVAATVPIAHCRSTWSFCASMRLVCILTGGNRGLCPGKLHAQRHRRRGLRPASSTLWQRC